eukprot:scaffold305949_cov33-Prasinocladus_malaysianus.AAC.1
MVAVNAAARACNGCKSDCTHNVNPGEVRDSKEHAVCMYKAASRCHICTFPSQMRLRLNWGSVKLYGVDLRWVIRETLHVFHSNMGLCMVNYAKSVRIDKSSKKLAWEAEAPAKHAIFYLDLWPGLDYIDLA